MISLRTLRELRRPARLGWWWTDRWARAASIGSIPTGWEGERDAVGGGWRLYLQRFRGLLAGEG